MATKFITVSVEIMHDKNLSANQKFILAEIEQLTQLDKGCVASNQHFSELIGIAKESVSRCINDLEHKGYITCKIEKGTRNHVRNISLNKMLRPPKQNVKTPLTKHQESKENKTINKTYIDFKQKFSFINEHSFNKLITHLNSKYEKLTKVRITNNIKKLKSNPTLFAKAVDEMVRLDYSGLFVPSKDVQVEDYTSSPECNVDLSEYGYVG